MRLTTTLFRLAILAGMLCAHVARGQAGDEFQGWLNAAKERFNTWKTENDRFDIDFLSRLRARVNSRTADQIAGTGFCSKSLISNIDTLRRLLDDQIAAQNRYQTEHANEAKRQIDADDLSRAEVQDLDAQRANDIKEAQTLLRFYEDQRSQLIGALPQGSTLESDDNLKSAVVRLDLQIKRQGDKVDTLSKMDSFSSSRLDSLTRLRLDAEQKLEDARESMALLVVQKKYWDSFYAMRRSQHDEYCPTQGPAGPMVDVR